MTTKALNRSAQTLGRLGKGVPKKFTPEEIKNRIERCATMSKARWEGHVKKSKKY